MRETGENSNKRREFMANRSKLRKIINHRKQLRENKAADAARRERVRAYEAAKREAKEA